MRGILAFVGYDVPPVNTFDVERPILAFQTRDCI